MTLNTLSSYIGRCVPSASKLPVVLIVTVEPAPPSVIAIPAPAVITLSSVSSGELEMTTYFASYGAD